MRRTLLSLLASLLLLTALAPSALAGSAWCDVDPPVTVTVNGKPVTVNVTISVPTEHANLIHTAEVAGTASGSTVTVVLTGPASPFRARADLRRFGMSAGDPDRVYAPGDTVTFTFANVNP